MFAISQKTWLAHAGQVFSCSLASVKSFCSQERGATAVEYVIIIAILSVVIVGGLSVFGESLLEFFVNPPV